MKKFLPLIAVVGITTALISVAVTRGFGGFNAATTSDESCFSQRPGSVEFRQCIKDLQENCKKTYDAASPEFRTCMKDGMGRSSEGNASSVRRPAAARRQDKNRANIRQMKKSGSPELGN